MLQQMPTSRGLPCPDCQRIIPINIQMLLSHEAIVCPNCGLKMEVDQEKSQESLTLIKEMHEAMQRVEEIRQNLRE